MRGGDRGAPVPEEVLRRAELHYGQEGRARPGSAMPSAMRPELREAPVPSNVLQRASLYMGGEGQPGSAAASAVSPGRSRGGGAVPQQVRP